MDLCTLRSGPRPTISHVYPDEVVEYTAVSISIYGTNFRSAHPRNNSQSLSPSPFPATYCRRYHRGAFRQQVVHKHMPHAMTDHPARLILPVVTCMLCHPRRSATHSSTRSILHVFFLVFTLQPRCNSRDRLSLLPARLCQVVNRNYLHDTIQLVVWTVCPHFSLFHPPSPPPLAPRPGTIEREMARTQTRVRNACLQTQDLTDIQLETIVSQGAGMRQRHGAIFSKFC